MVKVFLNVLLHLFTQIQIFVELSIFYIVRWASYGV